MRRKGGILPLLLLAMLTALAFWASPGMEKPANEPGQEGEILSDSLTPERHFGYYQMDSILALVRKKDPGGKLCKILPEPAFVKFLKVKGEDDRKFERVFFNKQSWENMARLKNLPIEMLKNEKEFGFRARVEEIEGVKYLLLPHGVVMGLVGGG